MKGSIMTEILLQQLEEKMMTRLSELESSRRDADVSKRELEDAKRELDNAKRENAALKIEREKLEDRVKNIIALLETVNVSENTAQAVKPMLVQA